MNFPQPHTGSYYAATVNHRTDYPRLKGDQTTDVCIVGAGFTGISTALHLAERGYKVCVVEANRVGWGASGRNGGQLIGGIAGEGAIARHYDRDVEGLFAEMRWEGHSIIRQRVDKYGIQCDLKSGYLDVAIKDRHRRDIEHDYERLKSQGFPHEIRVLTARETSEYIGTDAYCGALLNMGNGHLHPLNLCIGEARAAASLGATIFEQSPVVGIEQSDRPRVLTSDGSISADTVVIAGNAYQTVERNLRDIFFPVNSFIIATAPLDEETIAAINPHDVAVCDPNFVLEYFRLSADKRLLFGGRINYFGDDPNYITRKLRRKMLRIYPRLQQARIDYAWGGRIGVPLNRVPQFGRAAKNVFFCQAYSGHGVNVTHLAGRILADAVAGTLEQFDLFANVPAVRVPGGYALRKPLVALGVMYYKIRDRL